MSPERRRDAGGRPRLLILTPDYPPAPGGIQVVAHRLATGIERFEVQVLAPDAAGAREFDAATAGHEGAQAAPRVHRVHGGAWLRGGQGALLNAQALRRALQWRPEVTLSMHIVASPAAAAIRRARGAATVQYFHAEEISAKPALAAFAARHADASIAVSAYTAELIAQTGGPRERVHVIANGTDVPADPEPLPSERPTIVTVARVQERYKGHDTMVRALALVLAKVPDAQWVVIGDGSLRAGIEQLARGYGVEHAIRFLGTVSDEQRNEWLRRSQVLAMPSRLPAGGQAGEGFGIVYLEAGAYGKPVVAGNVGGARDAVLDGETGLLVDPQDPLAVSEAIVRLLREEPLARALGAAGRERALAHAWPTVTRRVEELLLAQLGRR